MKKLASVVATILFLTAASKGHAQVITQTNTFLNISVGSSAFSLPLTFSAFNSSLGTLDQVDYTFSGTLTINGYVTRTSSYNITFNLPYRLEGVGPSQLDAQTISSTISGSTTAGAPTPDSYNFTKQADGLSKTITPSSIFFESGLSSTHVGTNTYSTSSASLSGSFALTYDYTVAPEPSTWALLLGGLGLLVWRSRARRA